MPATRIERRSIDRYIHNAVVRWNALMSGLSVLIVLGSLPDIERSLQTQKGGTVVQFTVKRHNLEYIFQSFSFISS